jgi:hypothetical protein
MCFMRAGVMRRGLSCSNSQMSPWTFVSPLPRTPVQQPPQQLAAMQTVLAPAPEGSLPHLSQQQQSGAQEVTVWWHQEEEG